MEVSGKKTLLHLFSMDQRENSSELSLAIISVDPHLPHKGENVGEEEGEPADKEDDENNDKSLGSIDVVSQRLIPGDIIVLCDFLRHF